MLVRARVNASDREGGAHMLHALTCGSAVYVCMCVHLRLGARAHLLQASILAAQVDDVVDALLLVLVPDQSRSLIPPVRLLALRQLRLSLCLRRSDGSRRTVGLGDAQQLVQP